MKRIAYIPPDFQTSNEWFLFHNNMLAHNETSIRQVLAKKCHSSSPTSIFVRSGLKDYFFVSKIKDFCLIYPVFKKM